MKLVIDIDEDYYEIIKHDVEVYHNDFRPFRLIANGTSLPKGHGRLIDANELRNNWYDEYIKFMTRDEMESINGIIENAPTIIEADKEANDG